MCLVTTPVGSAQQITVSQHAEPAPGELAAPVRALLTDGGARAEIEGVTIDFWWVTALPLSDSVLESAYLSESWAKIEEGSLVGAARVSGQYSDIRGRAIAAGVYTLRFGVQPEDGDHIGTSFFVEFLLVSPAAVDTDAKPAARDDMVKRSTETTGIDHPAALSIDPPEAEDELLTVRTNDDGHKAVIFEVPVGGGDPLRFGLILIGKIEA